MKKKILALLLVVSMLAIALVSGTLAYFTDNGDTVNVFTIGTIKIDLTETIKVTDGKNNDLTDDKVVETANGSNFVNVLPGNYMKKEVTLKNVEENSAYVRVIVVMNNYDKIIKAIDEKYASDPSTIQDMYDTVFNGWGIEAGTMIISESDVPGVSNVDTTYKTSNSTKYNDIDFMGKIIADSYEYDYADILGKNEICYAYYLYMEEGDTVKLFDGLNCPGEAFGNEELKMFEDLKIEIYADAIQAEGFDTLEEAITALEKSHPMASLRNLRPDDLPVAKVEDADELGLKTNTYLEYDLESTYIFSATESYEEAQQSPYAEWVTDFYVSLDRDLGKNQIYLGGQYEFAGGWYGFSNGDLTLKANEKLPLLETMGKELTDSETFYFIYEDIVNLVTPFKCGVADIEDALSGATFTVELRITNPNDASDYYVIESVSYTFN